MALGSSLARVWHVGYFDGMYGNLCVYIQLLCGFGSTSICMHLRRTLPQTEDRVCVCVCVCVCLAGCNLYCRRECNVDELFVCRQSFLIALVLCHKGSVFICSFSLWCGL